MVHRGRVDRSHGPQAFVHNPTVQIFGDHDQMVGTQFEHDQASSEVIVYNRTALVQANHDRMATYSFRVDWDSVFLV